MAALDLNTVRQTIEARLATEMASSPAITTIFANQPFTPTSETSFVQCLVNFGSGEYLTLGGTSDSANSQIGNITINIFTKKGNYKESDPVLPINNYAWSKLGGEASVKLYKNSLILRLAMTEYPFVHKKAFSDAKANFIYPDKVIRILPKILDHNGILNIGSDNIDTIFNFAKKSNPRVKPTSIKSVKYFPKNSSVNIEKLNKILGKDKKYKKQFLAAGPSITNLEKNIVSEMMENDWDNYLPKLRAADAIVVDIETTSLSPRTGHVLGIALSTQPNEGIYVLSDVIEATFHEDTDECEPVSYTHLTLPTTPYV